MTCQACGQSNFNWKRLCDGCGGPLTASSPAASEREVRLSLPEPVNYVAEDARAVRAAFAHTQAPLVTPLLMAGNVLMFLMVVLKGNAIMSPAPDVLRALGATYGPAVTAGEWWRLGAAMFLHGGLIHLAFNMVALLTIGGLTERMFGRVSFFALYLLAGLTGNIASIYIQPFAVGVGASGAIFGLYGALFAYLTCQRASVPADVVRSLRSGGFAFVGYSLLFGVTHAGIDTPAHLSGFVAGALIGAGLASPIASASTVSSVAKRILVGTLGAAVVINLALRLPATDGLPGAMRALAILETASPAYVDSETRNVANGTLPPAQMAALLESRVLDPWREHRQRIAGMKNLPTRDREVARRTLSYMDHRIAAWQLQADAFRRDDMTLIEKSAGEQAAANAAAEDLVKSFGPSRASSRRIALAPRAEEGSREFEGALEVAQQLERAATQSYNNAVQKAHDHTLTDAEFATLIQRDILMPWDAQWRRIAELHASGRVEEARQRVEDYMRLSSEAWHLIATALRTHSPEMLVQAKAVRVRAAAAGSSITWAR